VKQEIEIKIEIRKINARSIHRIYLTFFGGSFSIEDTKLLYYGGNV